MRDLRAEPVTAQAATAAARLNLVIGPNPGPLNMPLLIRATTTRNGEPLVAEVSLELLLPGVGESIPAQ
jgi:hypothetical protein